MNFLISLICKFQNQISDSVSGRLMSLMEQVRALWGCLGSRRVLQDGCGGPLGDKLQWKRVKLLLLKLYGHDVVETHYKKYI